MQKRPGKSIRIRIKVNTQGDFTYEPSVKRLKAGEVVTWESSQGPFSIHFKGMTPFARIDFQSEKTGKEWSVSSGEVADQDAGHFHYAVAVYSEKEERVFLDAACPEIIVTP